MADQIAIPGEHCALLIEGVPIAATRNFNFNLDRGSYGNFVARGTSKWRRNFPSDMGGSIDFDGLVVVQDTSPTAKQFDDLFTYFSLGTRLTVVFTLQTETTGEKRFIYTAEAYFTALAASTPEFGEATKTGTLIIDGEIQQTVGTVS